MSNGLPLNPCQRFQPGGTYVGFRQSVSLMVPSPYPLRYLPTMPVKYRWSSGRLGFDRYVASVDPSSRSQHFWYLTPVLWAYRPVRKVARDGQQRESETNE